jgi:predicted ArsR family transcriptional regulator
METRRTGPAGETIDTPSHRALGSASRVGILTLIRAATDGLTANEVAAHVGLHVSTTRAHLDRLTEAGLLVRARASGGRPGRPAWRYRPAAPDPAPAPYRSLAAALLEHLAGSGPDTRAAAVRVGEDWGRHLARAVPAGPKPGNGSGDTPLDTVIAVLHGLGFAPRHIPDPPDDMTEVHLHTCPFLDLVAGHPDAMCGLHLGVVRGALEQAGGTGAGAALEPFGAPTACVVRIPPESASHRGGRP